MSLPGHNSAAKTEKRIAMASAEKTKDDDSRFLVRKSGNKRSKQAAAADISRARVQVGSTP